jgi:hypothetical protein
MDIGVSKSRRDENCSRRSPKLKMPNVKDLHRCASSAGAVLALRSTMSCCSTTRSGSKEPRGLVCDGDQQYAGKVVIDAAPKLQGTSLTFILDWAAAARIRCATSTGNRGTEEDRTGVQTWDPKPEPYIPVMNGQARSLSVIMRERNIFRSVQGR